MDTKNKWALITYLIYIIFWELLVIGGCSYAVFVLDKSGWWFVLAIFLSFNAYSPAKWSKLLDKDSQST